MAEEKIPFLWERIDNLLGARCVPYVVMKNHDECDIIQNIMYGIVADNTEPDVFIWRCNEESFPYGQSRKIRLMSNGRQVEGKSERRSQEEVLNEIDSFPRYRPPTVFILCGDIDSDWVYPKLLKRIYLTSCRVVIASTREPKYNEDINVVRLTPVAEKYIARYDEKNVTTRDSLKTMVSGLLTCNKKIIIENQESVVDVLEGLPFKRAENVLSMAIVLSMDSRLVEPQPLDMEILDAEKEIYNKGYVEVDIDRDIISKSLDMVDIVECDMEIDGMKKCPKCGGTDIGHEDAFFDRHIYKEDWEKLALEGKALVKGHLSLGTRIFHCRKCKYVEQYLIRLKKSIGGLSTGREPKDETCCELGGNSPCVCGTGHKKNSQNHN